MPKISNSLNCFLIYFSIISIPIYLNYMVDINLNISYLTNFHLNYYVANLISNPINLAIILYPQINSLNSSNFLQSN